MASIPKNDELIAALRSELESQQKTGAALRGKQAHAQLFLTAIDQSPEAIFFTDAAGSILYVNQEFLARSGYQAEEVIGKNPRFLKSGRHDAEFYKKMWNTLLGGNTYRSRIVNRTKSGKELQEEISISPVRDAKGVITNFIAIKSDISNLIAREMELKATNQELLSANAELQEFAHAASHDLQEPLRSIGSCLQLVSRRAKGKIDSRTDEFIHHAVKAAGRMKLLIEALLLMSKVKSLDTPKEEVSLKELAQSACENLKDSIEEAHAEINLVDLPTLRVHPQLITQLFQNLIGNAVKFRGEATPKIEVGALPTPDGWRIHISDNGIGISPDHFKQVFQAFKRLHSQQEYEGTGIGLALCKKIVEKHGGTIGVQSRTRAGTTFHFTLPQK